MVEVKIHLRPQTIKFRPGTRPLDFRSSAVGGRWVNPLRGVRFLDDADLAGDGEGVCSALRLFEAERRVAIGERPSLAGVRFAVLEPILIE